ncbi:cytochrome c [Pedobacter sp. BS3]|uniref:c-type cytochrome n=1 Tax=Pedobacter sp. BS3 TaxID=2567937 RepID=UPI0011ECDB58|nr:cytochrome c [Pedobacter sp. BS3]TZF82577.1 cytochrome c [Pedobacter sp. BS3]
MRKYSLTIAIASLFIFFVQAQTKKPAVQPKKPTGTIVQTAMIHGKALYLQYCVTCHQADGGGVPNLNPPLIKTPYVLGDKKRLIKILLQGLNEDIEIDGEIYSNAMPAFSMKDQEIADVLTYVRNSFGNKGPAVTAAEVKSVRATLK